MSIPLPEPGIYFDMPESVYHALPYWNYSSVKHAIPTMADYKAWKDAPKKPGTEDMAIGTMIERGVLKTHENIIEGFALKPKGRAPNGWRDEQEANGLTVITEDSILKAERACWNIISHPTAWS